MRVRLRSGIVVDVIGQLGHAAQPDAMLRHRGGGGRGDRALVDADVVAMRVADDAQRPRLCGCRGRCPVSRIFRSSDHSSMGRMVGAEKMATRCPDVTR